MYRYRFDEPRAELGAQRGLRVGGREITDVHPGDLSAACVFPDEVKISLRRQSLRRQRWRRLLSPV